MQKLTWILLYPVSPGWKEAVLAFGRGKETNLPGVGGMVCGLISQIMDFILQ